MAIALATILLSLSVPSFTQTLARLRVEGASCTLTSGANTIKTVTLASGVSFAGNVTIAFDPLRGLANTATLTSASSGTPAQIRIATGVMGRVQMCSPGGGFKGYTAC